MLRIEIIANHSVEENILEALRDEGAGKFYTKYPSVYGVGSTGPRMGDAIWPEENFALVVWCEETEARSIARAVAKVKEHFPDEGIKLFGLPAPGQAPAAPSVPVPLAVEVELKKPALDPV
ncbi:MAG: hypothetical protein LBD08_00735, partial [Treponema sp.]|nr:hypothetical protein [Treponema sp.]